jgi:nickel-dependent lactate racemase
MIRSILIPYGRETLEIKVPEEKLVGCLAPRAVVPTTEPSVLLQQALVKPIGKERLRDRAKGSQRVVVVIDDATRAVPSDLLLDAVLPEISEGGISPERVTVLVATGLHRGLTPGEQALVLGKWAGRVRIENHDAKDPSCLLPLGITTLGTPISLNRTFLEADLKILTGDVEFHQICGYGGGAKSIYPGLADAEAIRINHSRMDLPGTGSGLIGGNPVRQEIEEVGRLAQVDFLLTVVLDPRRQVYAAFAGDVEQAFLEACKTVDYVYRLDVPRQASLVITSPGGHPRDIDFYQSQKAIGPAVEIVNPGGDILLVASCEEGSGSPLFESWMEEADCPEDIVNRIGNTFVMGGHKAYQVARELSQARVSVFSRIPPDKILSWFLHPVQTPGEISGLIDRADSIAILPQATLCHATIFKIARDIEECKCIGDNLWEKT